jgi:hypothetical protein
VATSHNRNHYFTKEAIDLVYPLSSDKHSRPNKVNSPKERLQVESEDACLK